MASVSIMTHQEARIGSGSMSDYNPYSSSPNAPSETGPHALPDFVFPARSLAPEPTSRTRSTGRPLSASTVSYTRSGSMSEQMRRRGSPPALPTFNFNPASNAAQASPPVSPGTQHDVTETNSTIHERSGPEIDPTNAFKEAGDAAYPSPAKSDGALQSPTTAGPPGGRRRGHAHRRSAAISCHDLSSVLKPSSGNAIVPRGGSAPSSPSDQDHGDFPGIDKFVVQATSQPELRSEVSPDAASESSTPIKSATRARVGFSDDVEVIPRPLSIISSDASSTTTVRPGHSVSNSMSSILSGSISSSPAGKGAGTSVSGRSVDLGRPRTAGPVLDTSSGSASMLSDARSPVMSRPSPNLSDTSSQTSQSPISPKIPKKAWTFFGNEHSAGNSPGSPADSFHSFPGFVAAPATAVGTTHENMFPVIERTSSRRSSISRKSSKNKKKVRSWAGILSRKPLHKKHGQKPGARRSPTPPTRFAPMVAIEQPLDTKALDIPPPEADPAPSAQNDELRLQTDFTSWKPRPRAQPEEETMSPIIDLDAALGPFNTPSSYDPTWDMAMNNGGSKQRRMHSAMGASGAGMMYHRRAESAPEFENPRFKFGRLGSSSTMADVFEEDEEDSEWEDTRASDRESCTKTGDDAGLSVNMEDDEEADDDDARNASPSTIDPGKCRPENSTPTGFVEPAVDGLNSESSVAIGNLDSRTTPLDAGSRPNSATPSEPSNNLQHLYRSSKTLTPVTVGHSSSSLHLAPHTPVTPVDSPKTPLSDTHRIFSTAPSSISEDQTAESLMMGEPGPELIRLSVDYVPSLSSANSTLTRDSNGYRASSYGTSQSLRSPSLTGSTPITKKRSSMASLSRLIGSSHGEKSKLSIESRPSSAMEPERSERNKGKRISRLMNFWRPKSVA